MQIKDNCNSTYSTSLNNKVFDPDLEALKLNLKTILKNDMKKCADPARIDIIKNKIEKKQYYISSLDIANAILNGRDK